MCATQNLKSVSQQCYKKSTVGGESQWWWAFPTDRISAYATVTGVVINFYLPEWSSYISISSLALPPLPTLPCSYLSLPSLPNSFLPFPSTPFPSLPSLLSLRSRPLKSSYAVWGSAVSSPAGSGAEPSGNRIWCVLTLKFDIWRQQFQWFSREPINQISCVR